LIESNDILPQALDQFDPFFINSNKLSALLGSYLNSMVRCWNISFPNHADLRTVGFTIPKVWQFIHQPIWVYLRWKHFLVHVWSFFWIRQYVRRITIFLSIYILTPAEPRKLQSTNISTN